MTAQSISVLKYVKRVGYRITKQGIVIGPDLNTLKVWLCNSNGAKYLVFSVRVLGKSHQIKVHRLQAYQKYGDKIFEKYLEVRHKNSDPLDNSWDNIILGTHSANMLDVPLEIRLERAVKANATNTSIRRFNVDDILKIRELRLDHTLQEIADMFGTSSGCISDIVNMKRYK